MVGKDFETGLADLKHLAEKQAKFQDLTTQDLTTKEQAMQINPYLFFDSNCEAAFKFYEKVLDGKIEMLLRNEDAPADAGMPSPPERKQKIMHAKMSIDGQVLMASDAPPSHFHKPQGFAISITIKDVAEAERKFKALSEGGSANMPFGKTFFAKGFGMCVDQFGIPWMINCPAEGM